MTPRRPASDELDGYWRPLHEVVEKLERDMQDLAKSVNSRLDRFEEKLDRRIGDHDIELARMKERVDQLEKHSDRKGERFTLWAISGLSATITILNDVIPLLHH